MKSIQSLVVCLITLVSSTVVFAQGSAQYIDNVAWSPTNGLVVSSPAGLVFYGMDSLQARMDSMECDSPVNHPVFSPDGQLLAYALITSDLPHVIAREVTSDRIILNLPIQADSISDIAFNSDASLIAILSRTARLDAYGTTNKTEIWSLSERRLMTTLDFDIENEGELSWGSTQDTLWLLGNDFNGVFSFLNAINVNSNEKVLTLSQPYMFFTGGVPALNNHWVVFWTAIDAPDVPGFAIYQLDAKVPDPEPAYIIPYDQPFFGLTITEDGDRMAFATGQRQFAVFDLATNAIMQTGKTNEDIRDLSFSPDGTRLAVTTYSQSKQSQDFEVWETSSLRRLDTISLSVNAARGCQ